MRSRGWIIKATLAGLMVLLASGCVQERSSENPPIHINPNMDNQPKYRPQSESKFFADGATMRVPDTGTIALGELRDNREYYTGKDAGGEFISDLPDTIKLTPPLLNRGQERFNIYCSPCHGRTGDGQGIVVSRGYVQPPTFHSERLRELPDGYIFDVVTSGLRNMPTYRYQIPVDDRWAMVAYLRVLQRNHDASVENNPQPTRDDIK